MKRYLVVIAFFFCLSLYSNDLFFENATVDQSEYLMELSAASSISCGFFPASDEETEKKLVIGENNFKNGIVRFMKGPDGIIGFYALLRHTDEEDGTWLNTLSHLFLKPEYIGHGYGRVMFEEAMRAAREEMHWDALMWESYPNAKEFYKKMGAYQVGETPCSLNPEYRSQIFVYTLN